MRVYTVCHSVCVVWTHYSMVEPHSSNFRVIITNVLGVRIFRKFTVIMLKINPGIFLKEFVFQFRMHFKKVDRLNMCTGIHSRDIKHTCNRQIWRMKRPRGRAVSTPDLGSLEARFFPNLNGASLHRAFHVHPSIVLK